MTFNSTSMLFAALGMGALALSYSLYAKQMRFAATAKPAMGIVTDILITKQQERNGRNSSTTSYYAPVVEFRTEVGAMVTYRCNDYVASNRYQIGMPIEIRYDPANPSEAQLNSRYLVWLWPVTAAVIGVVFSVIGVAIGLGYIE